MFRFTVLIALTLSGLVACGSGAGAGANAEMSDEQYAATFEAMAQGNWFFVQAALDRGMDVNARDAQGRTLLHYAVNSGQPQLASNLLYDYEPDPNIADNDGKTPLDYARASGNATMVELLERFAANRP